MIVTIDGPAGAGKSSMARELARRLGFDFLDTGAMYRAVVWAAMQASVDFRRESEIERLADRITIQFQGTRVLVDGRDATEAIRQPAVTERIKYAASNAHVRARMTELQRELSVQSRNLVSEGRDQGTVVFPDAACKIFLTATPEERARRRHRELAAKGDGMTYEKVLESQNVRDEGDRTRAVGPLQKAPDAIEVCTDGMSPLQVLDRLEQIVRATLG